MQLVLIYTISGAVLFGYLFVKFLRRGAGSTHRKKWQHFFLHGLDVRRKIWSDPSYLIHFVALMIGLMGFAASIAFLLQHFVGSQK